MDDHTLVVPAMVRPAMETANRRLIAAIETPPEVGVERALDRYAAITWHYAHETDRRPDPGRLRQLQEHLGGLEGTVDGRKRLLIRDARTAIRRAAAGVDTV